MKSILILTLLEIVIGQTYRPKFCPVMECIARDKIEEDDPFKKRDKKKTFERRLAETFGYLPWKSPIQPSQI